MLQDDFLYEGTIRENILFGRPQAGEEEVLDAVRASHVKEFTDHFDQGLETLIGERGVKLSGGPAPAGPPSPGPSWPIPGS